MDRCYPYDRQLKSEQSQLSMWHGLYIAVLRFRPTYIHPYSTISNFCTLFRFPWLLFREEGGGDALLF